MAPRALAQAAGGAPEAQREPHVLVSVLGTQDDLRLIRHGWLLAQRLGGRITVLYVLCAESGPRPEETLSANRLFARSVGAALVEAPAATLTAGIAEFATGRGVTHLVLSDERHAPWYARWNGSLIDDLIDRLAGIELYALGATTLEPRV